MKMPLYNELPVFKAAYDLLLNCYRFSATLTREHKYTLGEKLKNETSHKNQPPWFDFAHHDGNLRPPCFDSPSASLRAGRSA